MKRRGEISVILSISCCLCMILCCSADTTRVAVIGAGVSGLTAARTLLDNWPAQKPDGNPNPTLEVFVLEARDRIGGRIWTRSASELGITGLTAAEEAKRAQFDVGAGWIHYSKSSNPLTILMSELGIEGTSMDHSLLKVWQCSANQTSLCGSVNDFKYTAYEQIMQDAKEAGQVDPTKSMWTGAAGITKDGLTRESEIIQFHMSRDAERRLGAPLESLSGDLYGTEDTYGPVASEEVIPTNGYNQIVEAIKDGSVSFKESILSGTDVATVTSNKKPVNVTLSRPVTKIKHSASGVEITTSDGTIWDAKWALVTVPLGVLKASDITFDPALSGDLPQAISGVGLGNIVKVILHFDTSWWASLDNSHFFGLSQSSNRGLFTYFVNGNQAMNLPVLITFATGSDADTADGMTNDDVWSTVRANLVKMFGNQIPTTVKNVEKWSWTNDQYSKGAYSYAMVGTETADFGRFEQLIRNRMFFGGPAPEAGSMRAAAEFSPVCSGEHTSFEHRGTVHGALESGMRIARDIIEEEGVNKAIPLSGSGSHDLPRWSLFGCLAILFGYIVSQT